MILCNLNCCYFVFNNYVTDMCRLNHTFHFLFQVANIAELLLREGLARCVDWSMGVVTSGKEKLRAAEK